jgi:hypothetical protein
MRKISYFRKILLFFSFRKTLKKLRNELQDSFNARIDGASRIYTVINIPSSMIEEPYNLRKEDIDSLAKRYIQDYSKSLSFFLNSKQLFELYDYYEIKKVDKYSYLVVFGFSLFDSVTFLTRYYTTLIIFGLVLLSVLIYFLL